MSPITITPTQGAVGHASPLHVHVARTFLTECRAWRRPPGDRKDWTPLATTTTPEIIKERLGQFLSRPGVPEGVKVVATDELAAVEAAGQLVPGGPDGWKLLTPENRRPEATTNRDPQTGRAIAHSSSSPLSDTKAEWRVRGCIGEHAVAEWLQAELAGHPDVVSVEHCSLDEYQPGGGYTRRYDESTPDVRVTLRNGVVIDVEVKTRVGRKALIERAGDVSVMRQSGMKALQTVNRKRVKAGETTETWVVVARCTDDVTATIEAAAPISLGVVLPWSGITNSDQSFFRAEHVLAPADFVRLITEQAALPSTNNNNTINIAA